MPYNALSERKGDAVVTTFASGAVVSDGVWLGAKPLLGLYVPIMNAAVVSVNAEVSIDGGTTYNDLLIASGSQAVEFVSQVGAAFVLSSEVLAPLAGYCGLYDTDDEENKVLVRLVATATQTAERELTWLMVA